MSHTFLGPMFHGTSIESADGILHTGSRPSSYGALGRGFYFSPEEPVADNYADSRGGDSPAVLRGQVQARNPIHFESAEHLWQRSDEIGYLSPAEYIQSLFRKGHDVVVAGRVGVAVDHGAFHPQALRGKPGEPWTDLT